MLSKEEISSNLRFTDEEACRFCKGKCCQKAPCNNAPSDFGYDRSLMEKALESGNYGIDLARNEHYAFVFESSGHLTLSLQYLLDSKTDALYMRPRCKDRPAVDIIHDPDADEGPCVFWSLEKGCALSYEDRPMFGRTLIPSPLGPEYCVPTLVKKDLIRLWKPYTEFLYEMATKLFPHDWRIYQIFKFELPER